MRKDKESMIKFSKDELEALKDLYDYRIDNQFISAIKSDIDSRLNIISTRESAKEYTYVDKLIKFIDNMNKLYDDLIGKRDMENGVK